MKSLIEEYCTPEWKTFIDHHKETMTLQKGEYIFNADDDTLGLYFINRGKVKVSYKQYDGSERLIRLAKDKDVLGHRGFGGSWKYTVSALALCETEVTFITLDVFNTLAKANAAFTYHLMMFFAEELRESESKIKKYPVKSLIARAIRDNYKVFGFEKEGSTKLSYTLSRKDIASMAGTTYETVVRTLAELNKAGVIKIDGKSIHILNCEALSKLACPENCQE